MTEWKKFTTMGIAGPHGEKFNNYLRDLWINCKNNSQLYADREMLLERKKYYKNILERPRHWNDILNREFSKTMLDAIDFWLKEIELELSK